MLKYLATMRLGWLDAVEYRTEFFVSIFSWSIRLFIAIFLWLAVTEARGGEIAGYSFSKIINYLFIIQIISSFTFSRVSFDIAHDIYRGDFANFMLKPLNYLLFRLTHEISKNFFRTVLSIIIFGALIAIGFGGIPLALWKIPAVILSFVGSYILNFCIVSIIALSAFWIVNATRLTFIYFGILTIFSGMLIPIDLFPPNMFAIFRLMPFAYIFFFPAKVLQAATLDASLLQSFALQLGFILLFGVLMILMFRRGLKHFEAVGR